MAKKPKILPSVEWLEPRVKAMRVVSLLSFLPSPACWRPTTCCSPICTARGRG